MSNIPDGFAWNEAELDNLDPLNAGLLSIVAFDASRSVNIVGTGFIIAASGLRAFCCTAAHNFGEILKIQAPVRRHHPTAIQEFLPKAVELDIDRKRVRAISIENGSFEMAVFDWVVWDQHTDIAFFALRTQDETNSAHFQRSFELDPELPKTGDEVSALAYQGMHVESSEASGDESRITISRRLMLRVGRVSAVYPDGHLLSKGPCVETTIPVFPGMSGGPVMKFGAPGAAIQPFGIVSSDPGDNPSDKWDRSIPGHSIIPLLLPWITSGTDGQRSTLLQLDNALGAGLPTANGFN